MLATQCDGQTLVHDWLYELRLFALEQLSAMRADLFLCDPHRIIVSGPTKLKGRSLDSREGPPHNRERLRSSEPQAL